MGGDGEKHCTAISLLVSTAVTSSRGYNSPLRRDLIELVNSLHLNLLPPHLGVHHALCEQRYLARLLDFGSLLSKVPLRLEPPAVVSAGPRCDRRYILLQCRIDRKIERRQLREGVEETGLRNLVILRDPLRGVIEVEIELVHDDGQDVPVRIADRLLPVVGGNILQR